MKYPEEEYPPINPQACKHPAWMVRFNRGIGSSVTTNPMTKHRALATAKRLEKVSGTVVLGLIKCWICGHPDTLLPAILLKKFKRRIKNTQISSVFFLKNRLI